MTKEELLNFLADLVANKEREANEVEARGECSCTVEKHKTWIASPATIPKSGERNRKIHSCMLYLISI